MSKVDERYYAQPDGTKLCVKCEVVKPLAGFYARPSSPDGFRHDCRDCVSARSRDWYTENSERVKARVVKWQAENPDRTRDNKRRSQAKARAADPERFRQRARESRKANPAKASAKDRRDLLRSKYQLTVEEYDRQVEEQGGVCWICQRPPNGRAARLHVDHCHTTGKTRGLLCHSCNTSLGHFRDDPALLLRAIEYLQRDWD